MRAALLGLCDGDREELSGWLRSSSIRAQLAQRARVVLLAADGVEVVDIARRVGVSVPTVRLWRDRYARGGTGRARGRAPLSASQDSRREGDQ